MNPGMTRQEGLALLKSYNQEPFHLLHALTVEGVMRWFAKETGNEADEEFWGLAGLLHDVDYERYPDQHCVKAVDILTTAGAGPELIHAVCCHGFGICSDVEPVHELEKILYATDELTGLIGAAARMRPSKSCRDMELGSLKKKFKDKRFAAGCSRDVIRAGAEKLGWELDEVLAKTLAAMAACEEWVSQEMAKLS